MTSTDLPNDAHEQMISEAIRITFAPPGDKGHQLVKAAAESARERGHYFAAGYLWTKATYAACGTLDRLVDAVRRAADCYRLGLEQADACSPIALAMRIKAAQLYLSAVFDRREVAVSPFIVPL